jgi:uncharacterized membrane protein HdeD (DUF308 family)
MIVVALPDWRSIALRGVVALAFGLLTLMWPSLTLALFVAFFGAFALVDGIVTLIAIVRRRPEAQAHRGLLAMHALTGIAVGVATFFWPEITGLGLLLLIAAWAFVTGLLQVVMAVRLRKIITNEWLLVLAGALSVSFAVIVVLSPRTGALALAWAIGWFAVLLSGLLFGAALRIRRITSVVEERGMGYTRPAAA